jgi:hypothetical protein
MHAPVAEHFFIVVFGETMSAWRSVVSLVAISLATLGAAYLLTHTPPHHTAAAALLIGAILISIVLAAGNSADLEQAKSSTSADRYKGTIASAISLGGGAAVLFALVWILIKVTGPSVNNIPALNESIGLPLIVIVGVTVLLIVIALVMFTFSVLGLSSAREALGLPDGSVRAIIALMLLVPFSITSIFLYNSIQFRSTNKLEHVTQQEVDALFSHAVVLNKVLDDKSADNKPGGIKAADNESSEQRYNVTFRELNGPGDDIAKQLIVMLGTLVTAVASFYFGSASVASASTAVLGHRSAGPVMTSASPNPITASGALNR